MTLPTVYCQTIDEVNRDLVQNNCANNDLRFQLSHPRDAMFPADAEGLVFDINHLGLTSLEQALLVRRLYMMLLPYPVVVSYDLEPETIETLEARGIIVGRRLEADLFRELAKAIRGERGDAAALRRRPRPGWVIAPPSPCCL
jgi:hypothetical protein